MTYNTDHYEALMIRLSNEKARLAACTKPKETVLESDLENYSEAFDALVEKWLKDGSSTVETMQTIGVMDWAHNLAEFEAPEIDSAWID